MAAASQFEGEEQQPPPEEEPLVVDDHLREAGVGQLIEPRVQPGPKMALSSDKGLAQF